MGKIDDLEDAENNRQPDGDDSVHSANQEPSDDPFENDVERHGPALKIFQDSQKLPLLGEMGQAVTARKAGFQESEK
jgi:hypothetical protein